jgi:hypothetical protein
VTSDEIDSNNGGTATDSVGDHADLTTVNPDMTAPWEASALVTRTTLADDTQSFGINAGGVLANGCSVQFQFAAGDGAADRIGVINVTDSAFNTNSVFNVAFVDGAPHVVTLIFDGTDLVAKIDGVTVCTLAAADVTSMAQTFHLQSQRGSLGDVITVDNTTFANT